MSRFTRQQRLTQANEFTTVFNHGLRLGDRQLQLLCWSNNRVEARLGLVIGKKYLRRAVDRNRLKRQIRESFRGQQTRLKGLDIVVVLRADLAAKTNAQLRQQLQQGWEQVVQRCATC
ncbi:MAG: ribonuclease P protein component [Gammaproteobacteria bacterium]|nr:ribonuclease P protein component [Gammaproteobacteria bacterium]